METDLPRAARLRATQALKQWRHWSPAPACEPSLLHNLPQGESNLSLLVGDGYDRWVLRLDQFDPRRLGLNRRAEVRAWQTAAQAGCAPHLAYFNPDLGVLVCRYLQPEPMRQTSPEQVAGLLRQIHALPRLHHRLDLHRRAQRYLELSGHSELPEEFRYACRELDRMPVLLRLCHNDLLAANRLFSGGTLWALDWEYAATGDPWFDLAVIVEGDGWSNEAIDVLVHTWLSRAATALELERLELQRVAYRALSLLWRAAMDAPGWKTA